MSMTDRYGEKIIVRGEGLDGFWSVMQTVYAEADEVKWRHLAMFALRETAGWPLELIGKAFGHPRGHVSRCVGAVRKELRERFRPGDELLDVGFSDPDRPEAERETSECTSN
ncbi:MAG: hypothetical protein KF777_12595 [Planctomycetaceae bacterium]|nr:hypothetical protein [Planctomycetaceae bacterium]